MAREMAASFSWSTWSPTFVLSRERTLWLVAAAAKSAVAFGEAVIDKYLNKLSSADHPLKELDALLGLVSIELDSAQIGRYLIAELEAIDRAADDTLIRSEYFPELLQSAIEVLRDPEQATRRFRAIRRAQSKNPKSKSPRLFGLDALRSDPATMLSSGHCLGLLALPTIIGSHPSEYYPRHSSPGFLIRPAQSAILRRAWNSRSSPHEPRIFISRDRPIGPCPPGSPIGTDYPARYSSRNEANMSFIAGKRAYRFLPQCCEIGRSQRAQACRRSREGTTARRMSSDVFKSRFRSGRKKSRNCFLPIWRSAPLQAGPTRGARTFLSPSEINSTAYHNPDGTTKPGELDSGIILLATVRHAESGETGFWVLRSLAANPRGIPGPYKNGKSACARSDGTAHGNARQPGRILCRGLARQPRRRRAQHVLAVSLR